MNIGNPMSESEYDRMKAHKDRLVEAEKQGSLEWRPISSAPKDGTLILGFAIVDTQTGNWKMRIMSHDSYAEVGMRNNWSGWGDSWVGPTHWMPLPAPPVNAEPQPPEPQPTAAVQQQATAEEKS